MKNKNIARCALGVTLFTSLLQSQGNSGFDQLPFVPVTVSEVGNYNGPGQSADYGVRVRISKSGRVYVLGQSTDVGVQNSLLIRCYKPDGTLLWKDDRAINGFVAHDLLVDAADNAYAIGMVFNDGGSFASSQDVGIVRYDSTGARPREEVYELDYVEPLTGTTFNQNRPTAAAFAPNGKIYVSGYVSRGVFAEPRLESHPVLFAVNPAGQMSLEWENSIHTEASLPLITQEIPVSLAVNAASELYELSNYGTDGNGVSLRKVSATGVNVWRESATVASFGTRHHHAVQVGLDGTGNPYVAGNVEGPRGIQPFIARFNPADGALTWVKTYSFGQNGSEVAAARVLEDGSVIAVGAVDFGTAWLIFRANSEGVIQWQQTYSSGSAKNLALDGEGNITVVGNMPSFDADSNLDADGDLVVARFSASGQFIWSKALVDAHGLTTAPGSGQKRYPAIEVAGDGAVYVTGQRNFKMSQPVSGETYPTYDAVLFKVQPLGIEAPSVRFISPLEGQVISGTFPKIAVEASSAAGIQKVVIYNSRSQILGVLTNAPYELVIDPSQLISVVPLYAVAFDNLGYASYTQVAANLDSPENKIEFTQAEFRVSEKEGPVRIQNVLQSATLRIAAKRTRVTGNATVRVTMNPGTAGTADYENDFGTQEPITLLFEDGSSIAYAQIEITKDAIAEPDETFTLVLSEPSSGELGAISTATVKIIDDDSGQASPLGVFQVNPVDYFVTEAGGWTEITVTRTVATEAGALSYYTQPNTATEGVDYLGTLGTLYFAPGESSKKLRVYALKDTTAEPQETFYVTFHQPENGATLGASYFAFVRIQDENGTTSPASVGFDTSAASVREDAGSITVVVRRSGSASGTASVSYKTANGSALSGSDYAVTSGVLTFGPGETLRTIQVPLVVDSTSEPSETFAIELSAPTAAVLGSHPKLTVTITSPGQEPGGETLNTWLASTFTPAEQNDPQVSGLLADPDHDGYPNLVEYALGLDPKQASPRNLLKPEPTVVNGQPALQVMFTRSKGRNDLDYIFEALDKIGATPCALCAELVVTDNGNGTESVRVRVAGSIEYAQAAFVIFRVGMK